MRTLVKALIIFVILYFIFQTGGILLHTTCVEIYEAANSTGVSGQMFPVISGIYNVFQAVAVIFGIGIFVILFAILLGGDRSGLQPYQ